MSHQQSYKHRLKNSGMNRTVATLCSKRTDLWIYIFYFSLHPLLDFLLYFFDFLSVLDLFMHMHCLHVFAGEAL